MDASGTGIWSVLEQEQEGGGRMVKRLMPQKPSTLVCDATVPSIKSYSQS